MAFLLRLVVAVLVMSGVLLVCYISCRSGHWVPCPGAYCVNGGRAGGDCRVLRCTGGTGLKVKEFARRTV